MTTPSSLTELAFRSPDSSNFANASLTEREETTRVRLQGLFTGTASGNKVPLETEQDRAAWLFVVVNLR